MNTRRDLLKSAALATGAAQILLPEPAAAQVPAPANWRAALSPAVVALLQSAGQTLAMNVLAGTVTAEHFHAAATAFQVYMANVDEAGGTPVIEQGIRSQLPGGPLTRDQIAAIFAAAQKASGVTITPAMLDRLTTFHYAGFAALAAKFTSVSAMNAQVLSSLNQGAQFAGLIRKAQGENLGNFCFYANFVVTYISIVVYVAGIADTILIPVGVVLLWLC